MAEPIAAAAINPAAAKQKRPKKVGPTLSELIVTAVAASDQRSGVSSDALKKALAAGGYDVEKNRYRVKTSIKALVANGILVQIRGSGASGSFRINREAIKKTEAKAKKPAKKPAAKKPKTATAKKPAGVKKTAKSPKKVVKKAPAAKKVAKPKPKTKKAAPEEK